MIEDWSGGGGGGDGGGGDGGGGGSGGGGWKPLSARTGTDDCFPGSLDLQLSASAENWLLIIGEKWIQKFKSESRDDVMNGSLNWWCISRWCPPPYLCYQLSAVEDTAGGLVLAKGSLESVDPWEQLNYNHKH